MAISIHDHRAPSLHGADDMRIIRALAKERSQRLSDEIKVALVESAEALNRSIVFRYRRHTRVLDISAPQTMGHYELVLNRIDQIRAIFASIPIEPRPKAAGRRSLQRHSLPRL